MQQCCKRKRCKLRLVHDLLKSTERSKLQILCAANSRVVEQKNPQEK